MVGKIELQACPRDYHQSVESFKQLDPRLERQYKNLEKLYIEAGFSGMENFGGNQTVAHTLQNKNFVYEAKKSFEDIGSPKPEGFIVHGLVRESSLNGYSPNDDEIADKFFKKVASMGNSVRIFSGANDFEALKRQIRLAKKYKLHVQVDISIQNIEYNKDRLMEFSCQCVDEGVDQLNYKSHSGNSNMKVLAELTEQMDEILPKKIKLGFHTHCTYGNAYNEIQTFVDAIGSDRGVVIHTGPGKDMCDGFAQPDPNKIIEMFPDKVVYNSDGLEKLNEATVKLNRQLTAVGLGNKDLKDVLRGVYKHKYSGEALEQHVNMVSDLFKNANIPGGGALYTVNDIKGAKCIGEQAKGNFEKRDYLVDYLKTAIEFHKYDGSPDDVTPFYFNREQSTKFFLNNFYTSKSFDANVDIVSLVKPENIKLDKKGKILQNQILGVYGRMPNKPDASLVKRALMERIEEVAENHGQIIDQEGMEKYITIGEEINKMYLSNKRRQLIIENVDKLTENYSNAQSEDEKKYYMIRAQHLQERLDNHKDSHDITLRDANYAEFLKSGKIDDFTKSKLKERLPEEVHCLIDSEVESVISIRKVAIPQVCTPSLLLEGQVQKAKNRIDKAISDYTNAKQVAKTPLPERLQKALNDPKHKYADSVILMAQFLRPTIDAAQYLPRVILNSYDHLAYKRFQAVEKSGHGEFVDLRASRIGDDVLPVGNNGATSPSIGRQ